MNKAQQQTKFAVEKALGKQRRERKTMRSIGYPTRHRVNRDESGRQCEALAIQRGFG